MYRVSSSHSLPLKFDIDSTGQCSLKDDLNNLQILAKKRKFNLFSQLRKFNKKPLFRALCCLIMLEAAEELTPSSELQCSVNQMHLVTNPEGLRVLTIASLRFTMISNSNWTERSTIREVGLEVRGGQCFQAIDRTDKLTR